MTARLYIEPEAEAELEHAADRYEESVPGLGLEFLAEMRLRTPFVTKSAVLLERGEPARGLRGHPIAIRLL